MKTVIRAFFRALRAVLGLFILLKERLTQPAGMQREPTAQAAVDLQCQSLALYQFSTYPFGSRFSRKCATWRCPLNSATLSTTTPTANNCCKAAELPKCPVSKSPTPTGKPVDCKSQGQSLLIYGSALRLLPRELAGRVAGNTIVIIERNLDMI